MKIYFCDLCNESIPQEDLEQNRVTSVRGKMICAKCVPSIAAPAGGAAAPAAGPAAIPAGARGAAILALVVGLAGVYLAWDAKGRLDRQSDPAPRLLALEQTLGQLRDQATRLETLAQDQNETLAKLGAEPSKLREEIAAQLARIEGIERDVGKLDNLLANFSSDKDELEKAHVKQQGFEQSLGELKGELAGLSSKVAALGAAPQAAPSPAPAAPAPADPAATLDADTKKLLADFNSKDGAVRWSAVDRIAKRHDPTLLPYLLPMLDDADAFVQFRAISAMRELNAKTSVGRLIKLLRDGDAIVRSEAQDALNTLTGNPQRFDLDNGSPADREKCVKAWEEWYEKNKARFEEPAAAAPAPPAKG
jgi:hypothetical protein